MIQDFKGDGVRVRDFSLQWSECKEIDNLVINWKQLFIAMPKLKRLDISKIPLLSSHLPKILLAASQCCREVEFLILPAKNDYGEWQKGPEIENVMSKLSAALKYWYEQGNCGGLRQLTVPTRSQDDLFRSSTQYIESVIQFCPNIEYLDGYNKVITHGDAYCAENWFLNLHTWETFNATCTSLREFNWAVVPFADSYFEVFAKHVKPQLRSLSLSANANWDYFHFFDDYTGPDEEIPEDDLSGCRAGYGERATNASFALKGCPALNELHIEIDFYLIDGAGEPYVDTELYGDDFWKAATIYCPLLETITLRDASTREDFEIQPVKSLTDITLLIVSCLTRLSRCELGPGTFTGDGIFAYLRCISKIEGLVGTERMLSVKIGGRQQRKIPTFYNVIVDLLTLLKGISEVELRAALCRTKTELHVVNPYKWKREPTWSETYMNDQLKPLLQLVKEKHPSLAIQVDIVGRNGDKFDSINGLVLDWRWQYRGRPLFNDVTMGGDDEDEKKSDVEDGRMDDE